MVTRRRSPQPCSTQNVSRLKAIVEEKRPRDVGFDNVVAISPARFAAITFNSSLA